MFSTSPKVGKMMEHLEKMPNILTKMRIFSSFDSESFDIGAENCKCERDCKVVPVPKKDLEF